MLLDNNPVTEEVLYSIDLNVVFSTAIIDRELKFEILKQKNF